MIKTKYKRNAKICMLSLAVMFIAISSAQADIVPASRLTTWQGSVGIPGGIPNRTTNCTTTACNTLYAGTVTAASINSAISGAPDNTVVRIPAGTYTINNMISINRNNVTLRGAGMTQTVLNFTNGGYGLITKEKQMADTPQAVEVNCETGEVITRDLTAAEIAERDQAAADYAVKAKADADAKTAADAAKASAQAKLAALGLTAAEVAALVG